ncbi:MAG: PEP-CTERM sorting domain-containing protein [Thermodesulfobacteriota bacterium]
MKKTSILPLALACWAGSAALAQATHIQYVDLADVSNATVSELSSWTWTFDLAHDSMALWKLDIPTSTTGGPTPDVDTADYWGSYNPLYDLHYVTLRIDPNNVFGAPTSTFLQLTVNGTIIDDWANPIRLYDWGVPGGSLWDPYSIADNGYTVTVALTGLDTQYNKTITLTNVNLEGCFDDAVPIPEPATMLLFGSGLVGLAAAVRRRQAFRG